LGEIGAVIPLAAEDGSNERINERNEAEEDINEDEEGRAPFDPAPSRIPGQNASTLPTAGGVSKCVRQVLDLVHILVTKRRFSTEDILKLEDRICDTVLCLFQTFSAFSKSAFKKPKVKLWCMVVLLLVRAHALLFCWYVFFVAFSRFTC
jgi:hypothetical protein